MSKYKLTIEEWKNFNGDHCLTTFVNSVAYFEASDEKDPRIRRFKAVHPKGRVEIVKEIPKVVTPELTFADNARNLELSRAADYEAAHRPAKPMHLLARIGPPEEEPIDPDEPFDPDEDDPVTVASEKTDGFDDKSLANNKVVNEARLARGIQRTVKRVGEKLITVPLPPKKKGVAVVKKN